MTLMSEDGVNKKNYSVDVHMKEQISTMLKIKATKIDEDRVTKDRK